MRQRLFTALVFSAPFILLALAWESIALAGIFPRKLFPPIGTIADTFVRLLLSGALWENAEGTVVRLIIGFLLAAIVGVLVGVLMGRFRIMEDTLLPAVSFVYPIPGLAYAPLFVLWFGLGDIPAVLLVGAASCFVIILNTWKGVKAVKPVWLRSAAVMGAD